jgi:hypothetical protein
MTEGDQLQTLKDLLEHPRLRQRRQGIEMARDLLRRDHMAELVQALLMEIVQNDLDNQIRTLARRVLDEYAANERPKPALTPDEATYMIGAVCPQSHSNYYDRRVYCSGEQGVHLGQVTIDGAIWDEILVSCPNCSSSFTVLFACDEH